MNLPEDLYYLLDTAYIHDDLDRIDSIHLLISKVEAEDIKTEDKFVTLLKQELDNAEPYSDYERLLYSLLGEFSSVTLSREDIREYLESLKKGNPFITKKSMLTALRTIYPGQYRGIIAVEVAEELLKN